MYEIIFYEDADGYSSIADSIYTLKKKAATDKSVTAIVEELGFSGTSHFYDFFRKETGMSPLEYRERNQ